MQSVFQGSFSFFADLPIVVEATAARLSSDAGLLAFREFDQRIGLTRSFADALNDPRDPRRFDHSFLDMTRARVYGVLADYIDQNDHDTLRSDPVFKLIADRSPDGPDLASQPTLSRFENAIDIPSLKRLRDEFIDPFIASFEAPPRRLTFDIDAVDDPAHGEQQLVLFHGYFEQHQYFPSFITSADNDQVVVLSLRHGTASASLGADDDLRHLAERLRLAWPDLALQVRGDAGYGVPSMYAVCEELGIEYLFGLAGNKKIQAASDSLLAEAVRRYDETREPQRLFDGFWYEAGTWDRARWVVVKVEANAQGTNRRFVVTNRPGAQVLPGAAYDAYAERGEGENRNKELKCGLHIDRASDHRFLANFFRLYLHAAAFNLLARFRLAVALPPLPEPTPEARSDAERRRHQQRCRQRDPLAQGQPCTWRTLLIKVAAEILISTRRVVVRLSAHWPNLSYFQRVLQSLASIRSAPPPAPS